MKNQTFSNKCVRLGDSIFFLEGFGPSWANEVVIAFLGSLSGCIGRVGISIF